MSFRLNSVHNVYPPYMSTLHLGWDKSSKGMLTPCLHDCVHLRVEERRCILIGLTNSLCQTILCRWQWEINEASHLFPVWQTDHVYTKVTIRWVICMILLFNLTHVRSGYGSLFVCPSICLGSSDFISGLYYELLWLVSFFWHSLAIQLVHFAKKASINRNQRLSGHELPLAGHIAV